MTKTIAKTLTVVLPVITAAISLVSVWADDKMLDAKIEEKVETAMSEKEEES